MLGPATARVLGYVPGRRLSLGEDMPAAAMREWSRWSTMPGYFFEDSTMTAAADAARVTGDVLAVGDTLWPELLAWLDARAGAAPPQEDGNVRFRARKPRR
ncbi:hypothetical protein [Isoptericola aurantiacus]|uniref:hypothetical protein n=1 Tax=Isoptericola aurantiacus TaxID=3377839 RepID=UPI00383A060A